MKYIATQNEEGYEEVFIFPKSVHHDAMAEALEGIKNKTYGNWERVYRKPVSAGFVDKNWQCHGSSETLGLKSRKEDTKILAMQRQ
jgi:hypothetical protein